MTWQAVPTGQVLKDRDKQLHSGSAGQLTGSRSPALVPNQSEAVGTPRYPALDTYKSLHMRVVGPGKSVGPLGLSPGKVGPTSWPG